MEINDFEKLTKAGMIEEFKETKAELNGLSAKHKEELKALKAKMEKEIAETKKECREALEKNMIKASENVQIVDSGETKQLKKQVLEKTIAYNAIAKQLKDLKALAKKPVKKEIPWDQLSEQDLVRELKKKTKLDI